MKPQERIAAIFASHLEPSEKLLLVALASYMRDDMLAAWPAPESLAELTGLSVSTTKALLTGMVARGAITRTDEGKRAKVTRICWEALPALAAKPAGRGGRRSPGEGSDDRTEPSDVRTVGSDNRTATVRCSDGKGSDNRTRTDQGTDQEPTTSVGGWDRTREDAPLPMVLEVAASPPPTEVTADAQPPAPRRAVEPTPAGRLAHAGRPGPASADGRGVHRGSGGGPRGPGEAVAEVGSADGGHPAGRAPVAEPLDLPALLDGDARLIAPLASAGIATPEALTALTAREVQMRPGIGPKRVQAIADALARHGLAFAADAAREPRSAERPGLRRLTDGWCKAYLDTTGQAYRWTPAGRNSDQRAAAELYDALGWTEDPSDEVRHETRRTVARYLDHCRQTGRVATLPDLVRDLARWRQEPGVRVRDQGRMPTRDGAQSAVGATREAIRLAQERLKARASLNPHSEAL